MVRQRWRRSSRAPHTIPGVGTKADPITQTSPVPLIPGTTTLPQSVNVPSTVPLFPQSVIENIIDHLHDRPADLKACCLVSKNWKARSQSHIFHRVRWTTETVLGWCKHIPPRSDGPAGFAKVLLVSSLLELERLGPIRNYFTSFGNVTSLTLRDLDFDDSLFDHRQIPVYFGHLRPRLTALTLISASGSCGKLLSFASYFPHVSSLTVSSPGELVPPDPVIGLRFRPLGGTLFLRGYLNRHTDFIKLLSHAPPPQYHTLRLEHWGKIRVEDFDSLLRSCSERLETLDVSACKGWYSI